MTFTPVSEREDYTFPAGTFDVRGWEVRTMADEEKVGEVHDVLIDEARALRYLDVDVGIFGKHVLLPVGRARVDVKETVVWVPGMTEDQFREIPEYPHDVRAVTRAYEGRLAAAYGMERQAPGVPPAGGVEAEEVGRLASLRELEDFDVADEDPDPRGWEVIAADGRAIGSVHDLVVDTEAMKVRYLDCDVDEEALGLEKEDRHILVPIGYARLDEPNEKVIVDAITSADVRNLPAFDGLPVTRTYEERLHGRFSEGFRRTGTRPHARGEEERSYAPRSSDGGGGAGERGE